VSLFLKTTIWPGAIVAGFGVNASLPPWPVIVIVTFVWAPPPPPVGGGVGDVGVLPPPPLPPQLAAIKAPAIASASVPGVRMSTHPPGEPDADAKSKRGAPPG